MSPTADAAWEGNTAVESHSTVGCHRELQQFASLQVSFIFLGKKKSILGEEEPDEGDRAEEENTMSEPGPSHVSEPGPSHVSEPGPSHVSEPGPSHVTEPGPSHVEGAPRRGKKRSRGEQDEPADSSQAKAEEKQVKKKREMLWLPDLQLTEEDKKRLQGTGRLRGAVLIAAVKLFKQQFQDATGRPCIRFVGFKVKPTTEPTLQLHIDWQKHHAFVTACDGKKVVVADSANARISSDVAIRQIEESYKQYIQDPIKNMEYLQVDKQPKQNFDCVIHSVANAYELLAADGNIACIYNQKLMRSHLLQCFINRNITEFPKDYTLGPAEERPFNWKPCSKAESPSPNPACLSPPEPPPAPLQASTQTG